ncbi:MAG TPA: sigma-70 family RNA polymerase sigma factor [Planctomycetaceae bacterium]|nr:sigma-70 family RNA polymerase sigma factor [Planctomycetaceae bacterium]
MIATVENSVFDLATTPVVFIDSSEFRKENAEEIILGPAPPSRSKRKIRPTADGIGEYLGVSSCLPLLTQAEETYYFRRMNFLRRRAELTRQTLSGSRGSRKKLQQITEDLRQATDDMQRLVQYNLRLVLSVAKKAGRFSVPFWDAVSEGNTALLRSVNCFDYSRGFRFSTYATWAIRRTIMRCVANRTKDNQRFVHVDPSDLSNSSDTRDSITATMNRYQLIKGTVGELLQHLDSRSQSVLAMRYGLGHNQEPMTLKEVGARFGVSKERIRQIEIKALERLRSLTDMDVDALTL